MSFLILLLFLQIVHNRTATALCLTSVKNEDKHDFSKIVEAVKVWLSLLHVFCCLNCLSVCDHFLVLRAYHPVLGPHYPWFFWRILLHCHPKFLQWNRGIMWGGLANSKLKASFWVCPLKGFVRIGSSCRWWCLVLLYSVICWLVS